MPATTVVVLAVVIAMFAVFMTAVGAVWIWTNLPDRPAQRVRAGAATAMRTSAL